MKTIKISTNFRF